MNLNGWTPQAGATGPTASGRWEVIVADVSPPVAVTNTDEDDWLYGWVEG